MINALSSLLRPTNLRMGISQTHLLTRLFQQKTIPTNASRSMASNSTNGLLTGFHLRILVSGKKDAPQAEGLILKILSDDPLSPNDEEKVLKLLQFLKQFHRNMKVGEEREITVHMDAASIFNLPQLTLFLEGIPKP